MRRTLRKFILILAPLLLLAGLAALCGGAWRTQAPPPAAAPQKPADSFHVRHERRLLNDFRAALKEDSTLAPAMLSLTRESVMSMTQLTPEQRRDFWTHVQKLQEEAAKAPREEIFVISGDD